MAPPSAAMVRRLERAAGTLASAAIARMDQRLAWYRAMGAEQRSSVGVVIQAGIAAFVAWFGSPEHRAAITADVFGTAPRELARAVSLQQTVELVRVAIEVVEEAVDDMVELVRVAIEVVEEAVDDIVTADEAPQVRQAVLLYSREVAFAAADVYARAAEVRGAWDARLEALVVDSLLRGEADEAVRSRAAALGWSASHGVTVAVGRTPDGDPEAVVEAVRRAARQAGYDVLTGVQGDRLVVVLGGVGDALAAARVVAGRFGRGAVVVGPVVPDLPSAAVSARTALSGLRAAQGWPDAPRPVAAEDLRPERAISGDGHARRALVDEVYAPLAAAGPALLETVAAFLEQGGSVEATARLLYVHPNTVRYRLRRVAELTGCVPTRPRDSYTLRLALTLGRLLGAEPPRRAELSGSDKGRRSTSSAR